MGENNTHIQPIALEHYGVKNLIISAVEKSMNSFFKSQDICSCNFRKVQVHENSYKSSTGGLDLILFAVAIQPSQN